MTEKSADIAALLAPTVQSLGLELLGVEYLPAPGGALLRLYIDVSAADDSGRAVGIEDCEAVSREVSAQLDVADPISSHYTLEVSSPGVDRPLFTTAQFARFTGESAKVVLKLPLDGRRRFQGTIVEADVAADRIVFDVDGNPLTVAMDNIVVEGRDKAKLLPDWAALGMAPAKDTSGRDTRPGKPGSTKASTTRASPARTGPTSKYTGGRSSGPLDAGQKPTRKPTASKPSRAE